MKYQLEFMIHAQKLIQVDLYRLKKETYFKRKSCHQNIKKPLLPYKDIGDLDSI
jgi:hypothetical protein